MFFYCNFKDLSNFLLVVDLSPQCILLLYSYMKLGIIDTLSVVRMVPIVQICLFNTNLEFHGELTEPSGFHIPGD